MLSRADSPSPIWQAEAPQETLSWIRPMPARQADPLKMPILDWPDRRWSRAKIWRLPRQGRRLRFWHECRDRRREM